MFYDAIGKTEEQIVADLKEKGLSDEDIRNILEYLESLKVKEEE